MKIIRGRRNTKSKGRQEQNGRRGMQELPRREKTKSKERRTQHGKKECTTFRRGRKFLRKYRKREGKGRAEE